MRKVILISLLLLSVITGCKSTPPTPDPEPDRGTLPQTVYWPPLTLPPGAESE